MEDYIERIWEMKLSGYCCSQVIIAMGLELQGKENKDLLNAMSALCNGFYSGLLCGALSGAACLLSMYDAQKSAEVMIPELVNWFQEVYETTDCEEILDGDPMAKVEKCPNIVINTYEKALEILDENHCCLEGEQ